LLKAGINVNRTDHQKMTPLACAVVAGHRDIAKILKEGGGTMNIEGSTLCSHAGNGDEASLAALLDAGVDPNLADYDGQSSTDMILTVLTVLPFSFARSLCSFATLPCHVGRRLTSPFRF
jgi:ankyrin repeat protein